MERVDPVRLLGELLDLVLPLMANNGGPTGGDTYEGEPDTHVLVRIDDFTALGDWLVKREGK
jgi:hypothetical protein